MLAPNLRSKVPVCTFPLPPQPAPLSPIDLQTIADLWAERWDFDPLVAQHPDAAWYRERIGRDVICHADAAEVRRRTMRLCQDTQDRRRLRLIHGVRTEPRPARPEQDVRELIGRPDPDVFACKPKSAEGARLFASLPGREHTGWTVNRTRDEERRRFVLLWTLTLAGAMALAVICR